MCQSKVSIGTGLSESNVRHLDIMPFGSIFAAKHAKSAILMETSDDWETGRLYLNFQGSDLAYGPL